MARWLVGMMLGLSVWLGGCGLSASERAVVGLWRVDLEQFIADIDARAVPGEDSNSPRWGETIHFLRATRYRFHDDYEFQGTMDEIPAARGQWSLKNGEVVISLRFRDPLAKLPDMKLVPRDGFLLFPQSPENPIPGRLVRIDAQPMADVLPALPVRSLIGSELAGEWSVDVETSRRNVRSRGLDFDEPISTEERYLSSSLQFMMSFAADGRVSMSQWEGTWSVEAGSLVIVSRDIFLAGRLRLESDRLVRDDGIAFKKTCVP